MKSEMKSPCCVAKVRVFTNLFIPTLMLHPIPMRGDTHRGSHLRTRTKAEDTNQGEDQFQLLKHYADI